MKVDNNLFDSLTEEARIKFDTKAQEYPSTFSLLKKDLESNYVTIDLTYYSVLCLYDYNIIEDMRITSLSKIFKH
jgi:hypothetical protein